MAATAAVAGQDAFLEGDTVLAMFGLALVNPPKIHIGTPRRRRSQPRPNTVVTFRPHMPESDLTTYHGLRSVTVRRALLDGIAHLLGERILDAVAEARRRDLINELEATEITGAVAGRGPTAGTRQLSRPRSGNTPAPEHEHTGESTPAVSSDSTHGAALAALQWLNDRIAEIAATEPRLR